MPPRRTTWIRCGVVPVLLATCAIGVLYCPSQVGTGNKAEDPVGAWKLRCVSPDGKPRECVTRPAKNVVFDDGVLSVDVDGEFAGQSYGLTYKGVPRGNALQGLVRWSFGWASGSFAFEGERIKQQVASNR